MEELATKNKQEETTMSVVDKLPEKAEDGFAYFWEKEAARQSPGSHDEPKTYRILDDARLRKLISDLESRTLGKKIAFSDVKPADTSVIKWVQRIVDSYPRLKEDTIDDLLSNFRGKLKTSSKEKKKFIVGILLLKGLLLIIHSRIDPGLFRGKDGKKELYTADLILHPKSVLRAALIDFNEGEIKLSAYEYDRSMSKGHAEFWGMEPKDVRWEQAGTVRLIYQVNPSGQEFERCAEFDEIENLFESGELSPNGEGRIGIQETKVIRVEMGRSTFTFPEFYQHFLLLTEDVKRHQAIFDELINPSSLDAYNARLIGKYEYEEDLDTIYKIKLGHHEEYHKKKHGRFTLCFYTNVPPGIRPLPQLTELFYSGIFEKRKNKVLHVGERVTAEPRMIGNLEIFNEIKINQESLNFIDELLKKIDDSASKKEKELLRSFTCKYLYNAIDNMHLPLIFKHIFSDYISKRLDGEFAKSGIFEKEGNIEFKSKDSVDSSPKKFSERLAKTAISYYQEDELSRFCILYGIEDNGTIDPIGNMPSDRVSAIQDATNKRLEKTNLAVDVHAIKTKGGFILMVLLIPQS